MEQSAVESPFLLEKLKVADVTYIPGKYEWSPATKDEHQWSTIPRGTAELIYKHYYADFVLFGYSPDEVMGFINASDQSAKAPSAALNAKSRAILANLARDDLDGNEDFICDETDTADLFY